jgi:hypothetical protein
MADDLGNDGDALELATAPRKTQSVAVKFEEK